MAKHILMEIGSILQHHYIALTETLRTATQPSALDAQSPYMGEFTVGPQGFSDCVSTTCRSGGDTGPLQITCIATVPTNIPNEGATRQIAVQTLVPLRPTSIILSKTTNEEQKGAPLGAVYLLPSNHVNAVTDTPPLLTLEDVKDLAVGESYFTPEDARYVIHSAPLKCLNSQRHHPELCWAEDAMCWGCSMLSSHMSDTRSAFPICVPQQLNFTDELHRLGIG